VNNSTLVEERREPSNLLSDALRFRSAKISEADLELLQLLGLLNFLNLLNSIRNDWGA